MKKFKVEIANVENFSAEQIWDSDTFQEPVEAETAEEAFELAKQYLLDVGESETEIFNMIFRITNLNTHIVSVKGGWEND